AGLFLGDPYFWGGRSPATPDYASGVDCSGLVSLAYRSVGMDLPRDAHEQWMRASPVTSPKPADLIFLSAQDNPKRIVHVMLYEGDNQILEGPGTGSSIRRVSAQERLGRKLDELEPGAVIDGQTITFGSYLP
ncbi:MAG: NlpC/P60 family protein, partial [Candidatus Omnitrophota bacterium]|nr:NlpC/P60 family protein [Candidatus Omnitrophota bacterium]